MAQQSKILHIITQGEWGGAQRYVFDLATELKKGDFEVEVAIGEPGILNEKLSTVGIKVHTIPHLVRAIKPGSDLKAYAEIKKICREIKPDIVHLNSSKAGTLGAISAKHAGVKKIIYTVHGFVFNEPMSSLKKQAYIFAEKFSAKYKDTLITVSEFDKKVGIKHSIAPADKFKTIHPGIKTIDYLGQQDAREKLNLPLDKKIIGTIANFYPTKGLVFLIDAARIAVAQDPNLQFAIIGDGDLRQSIEKQIKDYKLEKNITLLGTVDQAQLYVKAFDVFVLSSVKEGLPYSILESLQAQVPVVATEVGGIPEITNTTIVPPKNPNAIAQAIFENMSLSKKSPSLPEDFTFDIMVKKTKEVYNS